MTESRQEMIERLFEEASRLPADQRVEFLRRACGDDAARAQIESLLQSFDQAEPSFLETAAIERPADGDVTIVQTRPPADDLVAAQSAIGERYRLERCIGRGGVGRVYAATDTTLERRIAIKLLNDPSCNDQPTPATREHLLAEARAMAGLRHPNLCAVYEISLDTPAPFLVMEWIDGEHLTTAWRSRPRDERLAVFLTVVEAVAAMHEQELVHGDLKPANILLDRRGEARIVDFGLARSLHRRLSKQGRFGGTPGYAAPEQFDAATSIDSTADVYALGVLMFELLTERTPFEADSPSELVDMMKRDDAPLPEQFAPGTQWALQRICLAALERDRTRRYRNAREMLSDLQRYLRGETVSARPSVVMQRFEDQVETQLEDVELWLRQGLVTEAEATRLSRVLQAVLRPESHWILDSRRLTLSQITLYLGGWFALIALSIGMWLTGDVDGEVGDAFRAFPAIRYVLSFAVAIGLFGTGLWLQKRGERRISLGYHITACLAMPVAVWQLFNETEWYSRAMIETLEDGTEVYREWLIALGVFEPMGEVMITNQQTLGIVLAWLLAALGLRRLADSSAFTPFAALAGALTGAAAWASAGLLEPTSDARGLFGLWLFLIGVLFVPAGLALNRREEARVKVEGHLRMRRHDSWPVLTVSLLLTVIGLSLMAWFTGDIYTFGKLGEHDEMDVRAVAFIINGVVLQALAHLLGRRRTIVRARLAEIIRWISPSHFLGGLLALQIDAGEGWWLLWLIVLSFAAVLLCYLSAWRQWRPFLFTGLFYIAAAYVRAFLDSYHALIEEPAALDRTRVGLAIVLLIAGIATMVLAMTVPKWIGKARLGKWGRG